MNSKFNFCGRRMKSKTVNQTSESRRLGDLFKQRRQWEEKQTEWFRGQNAKYGNQETKEKQQRGGSFI